MLTKDRAKGNVIVLRSGCGRRADFQQLKRVAAQSNGSKDVLPKRKRTKHE
jgi:hypothetical protein